MPIILNDYTDTFEQAWNCYEETLTWLRNFSGNVGTRRDKVFLPDNIGTKEGAFKQWNFLLSEVVHKGNKITDTTLIQAVFLYCQDRMSEAKRGGNVKFLMLLTFLRTEHKDPEKIVLVLDYIRESISINERMEKKNAEQHTT
tara:strand:- start:4767 stop:5195 length:429 start_codon:yes stop_codon:yes gene_type:complete